MNKVRDFSIYLWMKHADIDKVSAAFGISKSRINQIIKAVDKDYTAYSIPYWQHVEEQERKLGLLIDCDNCGIPFNPTQSGNNYLCDNCSTE